MGERGKTLFVAILFISAGSYLVMEFGPRACGRSSHEPRARLDGFAVEACRTFVRGDEAAFADLLVRKGDISVDERYGWFPFSGATEDDWDAWAERARTATAAARDSLGDARWTCGEVVEVERSSSVQDTQGRVPRISVAISSEGRKAVLDLGPSVRAKRGRVFQGERDGVFVRMSEDRSAL